MTLSLIEDLKKKKKCLHRILHFKTQFSKICVKDREFLKNICEKISGKKFLIKKKMLKMVDIS